MTEELFDQMLGSGTIEDGLGVDMVIYGRSGAGKTYRAATAPKPYIVSPDPTGHKAIPFSIPGKLVKETRDIFDVLERFEQGHYAGKVSTLILDGVSFIYDLFTEEMGRYFVEYHGAKDPDNLPIQAYKKITNRYKDLLRRIVNLTQIEPQERRVHVILTTLDERVKESEDAPFNIRPMFGSEKMNQSFPALFSTISYIAPNGGEDDDGNPDKTRSMLFSEVRGILAKDRPGIFDDAYREAPNLSDYLIDLSNS